MGYFHQRYISIIIINFNMAWAIFFLLTMMVQANYYPDREFKDIVDHAGYKFESYQVQSNGYLLMLYRIPGLKTDADNSQRPPVLL